jgi:CheY-like chemotaxis protein
MNAHVLVVEDNPANQELLCDWLESEGYKVSSATNLNEAYLFFAAAAPQIVLLDVQLGAEDGLTLASWVREHTEFRETPIIAVTAHAIVTDQARMQEAGCNACVSKPIDFKDLATLLDRWLPRSAKI